NVRETNDVLTVDLTNPDVTEGDDVRLPKGQLHVLRTKFLWDACCYERLQVSNYGPSPAAVSLLLNLDADFADIFEVRGTSRPRRGTRLPGRVEDGALVLEYRGLDDVVRRTRVHGDPAPAFGGASALRYEMQLAAHETRALTLRFVCEREEAPAHRQ